MSQPRQAVREPLFSRRTAVFVTAVLVGNIAFDMGVFALRAAIDPWFEMGGVWTPAGQSALDTWVVCSEAFVLGLLYAQVVLIAIWVALFPGNSVLRIFLGTLAIIVGGVVLLPVAAGLSTHGLYLRHRWVELDRWQLLADALAMVAWGWTLFYFAQAPFWILRRAFHMRIIVTPSCDGAPRNAPLRLLDMFGVLAFVAVPLGLLRVISPDGMTLQVGLALAAISMAMWLFGCLYLAAVFRAPTTWQAILGIVLVSEMAALTGTVVYPWVEPRAAGNVTLIAWAMHASACAGLLLGLGNGLAARFAGVRLLASWPRAKRAEPARSATTSQASPEAPVRP